MNFLIKIEDKDIEGGLPKNPELKEELRKTARAVVFNSKNKIALQFVSKHNYYKLPGGGVEEGESIEEGLRREILEEVGCEIDIIKELGFTVEYKNKKNTIQISYAYLAKVRGVIEKPCFEESEIEEGMQSLWVSLDEAINLIEKEDTDDYSGKFIKIRDLEILRQVKRTIFNI